MAEQKAKDDEKRDNERKRELANERGEEKESVCVRVRKI